MGYVTDRTFAIALTADERNLLISALILAEEHGADTGLTRPVAEMLEHAPDLQDRTVREALSAGLGTA
jgi:hypothetical protein